MNLLTEPAPSTVAIAGFTAVVFAVTGGAVTAVTAAARATGVGEAAARAKGHRTTLVLLGWLAFTGLAAWSGLLGRFDATPPPLLPFIAATAIASTALALSPTGAMLARGLPLAALVGFQAFRVPLELVLRQLAFDGVLPVQMTLDGMNHDIWSGVLAALVAAWATVASPPRFVVGLWNVVGTVLLLTIFTIAMLSTPGPLRVFPNDPANTIIATVPFVWLPTVLVQVAWIGHLLVFRRLAMDRRG
jgi:hypothetical protein